MTEEEINFEATLDELYFKLKREYLNIIEANKKSEICSLEDVSATIMEKVKAFGCSSIGAVCKCYDDRYNRTRDRKRIKQRNSPQKKRIMTEYGEIVIEHRLYKDKITGKSFYALDEMMSIERYSRIEKGFAKKLVSDAVITSYGKSSQLNNNFVSRQTVNNLVKRVDVSLLKKENTQRLREVGEIFIEADEDHIHLQNGQSAEVKLVYVHEGVRDVCKHRKQLINPMYFASCEQSADTIWNDVYGYLYNTYKLSRAKIHLSGDGAIWIKQGLDIIPKSIFHLDKFHVYKSITQASYGNFKVRSEIIKALKTKDYEMVGELYNEHIKERTKKSEKRSIKNSRLYLENNEEGIDLLSDCKCRAESHVSHVLSTRMSSRPMGWGTAGAEIIANLRAYLYSGGDFAELQFKKSCEKVTKEKVARKKTKRKIVLLKGTVLV